MKQPAASEPPAALFDRVASILEQARGNVVRVVNTQMVHAYWLIGREIVQELQGGEERAKYGQQVVDELAMRLTERYGRGFSGRNLKLFRQFYLTYTERFAIVHPTGAQFGAPKLHSLNAESEIPSPTGIELSVMQIPLTNVYTRAAICIRMMATLVA